MKSKVVEHYFRYLLFSYSFSRKRKRISFLFILILISIFFFFEVISISFVNQKLSLFLYGISRIQICNVVVQHKTTLERKMFSDPNQYNTLFIKIIMCIVLSYINTLPKFTVSNSISLATCRMFDT